MRGSKGVSLQDLHLPRIDQLASAVFPQMPNQGRIQVPKTATNEYQTFTFNARTKSSHISTKSELASKPQSTMNLTAGTGQLRLNSIDRFLHREQIGLNVAEQMKMLNTQISNNKALAIKDVSKPELFSSTSKQKLFIEQQQQQQQQQQTKHHDSQPVLRLVPPPNPIAHLSKGAGKYEQIRDQSSLLFNLTQPEQESKVQTLKNALSFCNTSALDNLAKRQQRKQIFGKSVVVIPQLGINSGQAHHHHNPHIPAQSQQVVQPQKQFKIDELQTKPDTTKMTDEKLKTLKRFYEHFDADYSQLMEQVMLESSKEDGSSNSTPNVQDFIPKSRATSKAEARRFKRVDPIRPDILFNIKQMVRMQRLREEKLHKDEVKAEDMIEFMRKRNQIQIILESTKKIRHLKNVADLIEGEIVQQDNRISDLLQTLIDRFALQNAEFI